MSDKLDPESEEVEHKSELLWEGPQRFDLAKTIIAFANGRGGSIIIERLVGDERLFDSARLDDFVNKYASPRVSNITSSKDSSNRWHIAVAPSTLAPHVIGQEGSFNDRCGRTRSAFHPGQIYVRHSSKSEPATGEDVQKLIQQTVGAWLGKLGRSIQSLSTKITSDPDALPVNIVQQGGDMTLEIHDVSREYPYFATTAAKAIGRSSYWIGLTANRTGMKSNPQYCYEIAGPSGRALYTLHNETAIERLRELSLKEAKLAPLDAMK